MKTIKLKNEEAKELRDNSLQLINYQQMLGALAFQRLIINDEEREVAQKISKILQKENEINGFYVKKYGDGQLNLDKGEFNTIN